MQLQVSFRDFPRISRLYLDYLYNFDAVRPFYGSPLRPYELLTMPSICANSTLGAYPTPRRARVAAILERQNRHLGAEADVFANIKQFRESNCCAIVTGQQVGLFGGPLFTVFKTLAAVRLAHELTARGLHVVPIFWINDIDHDFEEVNHCHVLDAGGKTVAVQYHTTPEFAGMPVGHIRLGPEIESALQVLEQALPDTPFRSRLMEGLRDAYRPGLSYSVGFSRTLLNTFRGQGLILMDPLDAEFQELTGPIYRQAIVESEGLIEALGTRSRELEAAGYHAQIHTEPHATLLFVTQDGKRYALQRFDHDFHLKGTDHRYSESQLLHIAAEESWRLSPNVALRPIVQDFLLPTAAYIGGPSEVAYFAQLHPLYQKFRRPMPVMFPRPSFTLVESQTKKLIEKHQMELVDFFAAESEVLDRAFYRLIPEPIATALAAVERIVPAELESLRPSLADLDATLADALDKAQQKVAHHLMTLRAKVLHAEERGHHDLAREIQACMAAVYPNQNLQERDISIWSFLAHYGPELVLRLYEQTDLSCPDHRVIIL